MKVTVAAAVGLLLQVTTKSRSRLALLTNNVLVSEVKEIVCSSFSSSSCNSNLKSNYFIPRRKRRHTTSTCRLLSLNHTNNNTVMAPKKRVSIIGSGNWGSAIAKITGNNVRSRSTLFESQINMYVYEEVIDGKKLTEIINTTHENVKYLPGIKLPENVIAVPDVVEATSGADILIFVLPHQFVKGICKTIKGKIKRDAISVSLIKIYSVHRSKPGSIMIIGPVHAVPLLLKDFLKTGESGFDTTEGGIRLLSDVISENLGIECAVLMGANLAHEVASEAFCESTIGAKNKETGNILKTLFDADYFRCSVVSDAHTVEACGALKNVVAIGSGITDGLNMGDNTKAAVLRLGMMEMIEFIDIFFKGAQLRTFFESSGLADLVATCHGGRNRKLGEALVKTEKTVPELEKEILNGQSFQGPPTAKEVYDILKEKDMLDRTLSGTTTPNNCNEGVLCVPQSSSITGTSTSDCLFFQGHSLGGSYPSAEKQLVYSTAPADRAIIYNVNEFSEIDGNRKHRQCVGCPMFVAVHLICQREMEPQKFISLLKNHPEHKTK